MKRDISDQSLLAIAAVLAILVYLPFIQLSLKQTRCAERYDDPVEILRCQSYYTRAFIWMIVIFLFIRLFTAVIFFKR